MPYYLSQSQLDYIDSQFRMAPTGQPYADRYDAIYEVISDPDVFGSIPEANVYAWFGAAAQANRGIGGASDFIRAYTNAQSFIRTGQNLTTAEMQDASNAINTAVWSYLSERVVDIDGETFYALPTVYEIGLNEATATMNELPFASAAIWSGNPLYIGLGHSDFYQQNVINDTSSTYDLLVMREAMLLAGLQENIIFNGGFGDLTELFFGQGVAGTLAAFSEVGDATAATRDFLASAYGSFYTANIGGVAQFMSTRTTVGSDAGEVIPHSYPGQGDPDIIHGGGGDDLIHGDNGNDLIDGGAGHDTVTFTEGAQAYKEMDVVLKSYASDVPFAAEVSIPANAGGAFVINLYDVEELVLGFKSDVVDFRAGTALEVINGLGGSEEGRSVKVEGYDGYLIDSFNSYGNTLRLENYTTAAEEVRVKLDPQTLSGDSGGYLSAGADYLTLRNFDDVIGTSGREVVTGSGTSNYLFGMSGNDLLTGEGATDFLDGGDGDDELYGGFWLGVYPGAGENPADVYTDDGVKDFLVGGTGFDIYYAGHGDLIQDSVIDGVERAAAAGPAAGEGHARFIADGTGEVFFEGALLDGGKRIPFLEWGNYQPHPDTNIAVVPDGVSPYSPIPSAYYQRELFVGGTKDSGILYYRVMNAYTFAADGTQVDEWLLIVELAGTGKALSISGIDYTPGQEIADGFLGIAMSSSSMQMLASLADEPVTDASGAASLPSIHVDEVLDYVEEREADLSEESTLGALAALTNEVFVAAASGAKGTGKKDDGSLSAAAKGPGGGGGGGGDPEPEPPATGSGFMGMSIVNPDPIPDTTGNDNIRGGNGSDTLIATLGDDTLKGAGGDDLLDGGSGGDLIDGGSGIDTLDYGNSYGGVTVQLWNSAAYGGHADGDTIAGIENVLGSGYSDVFEGDAGANYFAGYYGNDYFEGRGGADTFEGGLGNDAVGFSYETEGTVSVDLGQWTFGGLAAGQTFISIESFGGTNNAAEGDILIGSEVRNDLYGYAGDDTIRGFGGEDLLNGGTGRDNIDGGDGNDTIIGGRDGDVLSGGAGYNVFTFNNYDTGTTAETWDIITDFDNATSFLDLSTIDADTTNSSGFENPNDGFRWVGSDAFYNGLAGDLRYEHMNGDTFLMGETDGDGVEDFIIVLTGLHNPFQDNFLGNTFSPAVTVEPIYGTEGNDDIFGTDETDLIYGLGGDDYIRPGSGGQDTVFGGDGNDEVYIGQVGGVYNSKEVHGDAGNDYLQMGLGNDTVYGGAGNDTIWGHQYHDLIFGGEGNDYLAGDLSTANGRDTIYGGAGDDYMRGGKYIDYFDGGAGIDTVSLSDHGTGVFAWIDLALGRVEYGTGEVEMILNVESIVATSGSDTIYGDDGANVLEGLYGDDVIHGRGGDDILEGYDGADTFVFAGGDGSDTILDFEDGIDRIDLSATGLAFADLSVLDVAGDATVTYGDDQITILAGAGLIQEADFILV